MLIEVAIALFIIGAVFGLTILISILRGRPTPKPVVLFHGLFVTTGLILVLITYLTGQPYKLLGISLGLFIIATIGGFTLLFNDLVKKPIPKWLAILHPIVAASGLVVLVIYALPTL